MGGVLGEEDSDSLHPSFHGNGRFMWKHGTPVRSFKLAEHVKCPSCRADFVSAIIVSRGPFIKPIIFGYESEPA